MKKSSALIGFMLRCSIVTCISVGLPLFVAAAAYGQKPPKIGMVTFQEGLRQLVVEKDAALSDSLRRS